MILEVLLAVVELPQHPLLLLLKLHVHTDVITFENTKDRAWNIWHSNSSFVGVHRHKHMAVSGSLVPCCAVS